MRCKSQNNDQCCSKYQVRRKRVVKLLKRYLWEHPPPHERGTSLIGAVARFEGNRVYRSRADLGKKDHDKKAGLGASGVSQGPTTLNIPAVPGDSPPSLAGFELQFPQVRVPLLGASLPCSGRWGSHSRSCYLWFVFSSRRAVPGFTPPPLAAPCFHGLRTPRFREAAFVACDVQRAVTVSVTPPCR